MSCFETAVFPVHGVPVMRMTRFMFPIEEKQIVIGCAGFLVVGEAVWLLFVAFNS